MFFAQLVTGAFPGAVTETPGLLGKVSVGMIYFIVGVGIATALGQLVGFLLGFFRLLFNTFKYRWAFPAAILVLLLLVGLWVEIVVRCLHITGAVGDHSAYWGQELFFLFLLLPGLGGFFHGAVNGWVCTPNSNEILDSFGSLGVYLSVLILYGTFVYGVCLSYAYVVTVWALWVSAGSLLIPPIWMTMPIWCPIYEGYQTGNWQNLIKLLSLLGLCFVLALPGLIREAFKKKALSFPSALDE